MREGDSSIVGDVRVTRCTLKPQLHLLQVSSKLLFQLAVVSNIGLSRCGVHAYLWIGLVLLAKSDSKILGRPRELRIALLLVPK